MNRGKLCDRRKLADKRARRRRGNGGQADPDTSLCFAISALYHIRTVQYLRSKKISYRASLGSACYMQYLLFARLDISNGWRARLDLTHTPRMLD